MPPGYTSSFQQAAKHWNVTSCVVPSLSSEGIHEAVCEEALKIQKRRRVPRECVCERQRERERERGANGGGSHVSFESLPHPHENA